MPCQDIVQWSTQDTDVPSHVSYSVVHVIFSYIEAERTKAILNKNKHSRGGDGGGIRNIGMVEGDDEAKGKNIELLEGEADNNKDKVDAMMRTSSTFRLTYWSVWLRKLQRFDIFRSSFILKYPKR